MRSPRPTGRGSIRVRDRRRRMSLRGEGSARTGARESRGSSSQAMLQAVAQPESTEEGHGSSSLDGMNLHCISFDSLCQFEREFRGLTRVTHKSLTHTHSITHPPSKASSGHHQRRGEEAGIALRQQETGQDNCVVRV